MGEHNTTSSLCASLRKALLDRWLGEDDDPDDWTDEMLMKRIEDLVGEGWHHAGKEMERRIRLAEGLERLAGETRFTPPDPDGALALGFSKELDARRTFAREWLDGDK